MSDLAREAGISKGLLYHYFPSKRDYFGATLAAAAAELAAVTEPDPALPPADQLAASLDAYLAWIEQNADGYRRLLESAGSPDVRPVIDEVRERTVDRIVDGVSARGGTAALRIAVRVWRPLAVVAGLVAIASAILLYANRELAGDLFWLLAAGRYVDAHGAGLRD